MSYLLKTNIRNILIKGTKYFRFISDLIKKT
jgi:hypothetical protein